MDNEPEEVERHYFARWVRHTFFGWLLGFAIVIVLAIAWDVVGGGAQFMVGVGMGAGVGYAQWRLARHWFDADRQWVWASVIGMGTPFVLGDIVAAVGVQVPYSLALYVVMGGLLVGLMQRRLLSPHSERANWWVPACVVGWALPASLTALGEFGSGGWGVLASTTAMFFGGAVLGAVTGGTLVWMLRRPAV